MKSKHRMTITDDAIVITKEIETKYTKDNLELKLRDIGVMKSRLREQNVKLAEEYNKLIEEENELKEIIAKVNEEDRGIEVIK